jgi:hypothetical protein
LKQTTEHYERRAGTLRDLRRNVQYRRHLLKAAANSVSLQEDLRARCREDLLFYVNTFCFTYDPRHGVGNVPFITWPFQNEALLALASAIGRHDVVVEKSRDMGASWLCLLAFEHRWRFFTGQSFLLGSRNESYVDDSTNPKSLFWKLDYIRYYQPGWLVPRVERKKLHLGNLDLNSVISGESTTGDFARGDRRTAVLLDEFAYVDTGDNVMSATADVTNSRILNSTPKGTANAFYECVQNDAWVKLRLHWPAHPVKAKGLYWDVDGKPRSPWYDRECARRTPAQIAQELDIDYLGSGGMYFDGTVVNRLESETSDPVLRGTLEYDTATAEPLLFHDVDNGPLLLWCQLEADGRPAANGDFVIGVDVATGVGDASGRGASNSVASVVNILTGEKVCELALNGLDPVEFARYCVALARWFRGNGDVGAQLIWESNGPGQLFGKVVTEDLLYRFVYFRQNESSITRKSTTTPGFHTTQPSKIDLLGRYRSCLADRSFKNPSRMAVRELRSYVYRDNGSIVHAGSINSNDPTAARDNHGDRVIADALACKMMVQRPAKMEVEKLVPRDSFKYRMTVAASADRNNGYAEAFDY